MRLQTNKCRAFGHREFILDADTAIVPEAYLAEVIDSIETMVADGSVFESGQTFQIGWQLTLVSECGGLLSLCEPDMQSMPIVWQSGITQSLRQMMLQRFMLDSVSLQRRMLLPNIRESLVVCTRYTETGFFMTRSEPTGSDSGWFIGCLNEGHDHNMQANLRCVSLYEAYLNQRGIQGFASFPVGSRIVNDPKEGTQIFLGEEKCEVARGSMLDDWIKEHGE